MERTSSKYAYSYSNNLPRYHHAYLLSPLLEMLYQAKSDHLSTPRLLDLGCGNGSLSHVVAQQGWQVIGVDNSPKGINIAQSSFPDCQFICGDIYDLPFLSMVHSFDLVLAVEVIEHLYYPKELVRAAKKCLKPNGRLILTTPYHGYLKNLILAITGKLDNHFTVLWDNGHIKFFSVKTLTQLLKNEGAYDIKFQCAGRFPYLWKSMLCSCRFSH